uniref:Uncharacterized protein n=1 Tax=Sipha flava TaxID=143950 RepID=A0A2S2RA50_9HEMI
MISYDAVLRFITFLYGFYLFEKSLGLFLYFSMLSTTLFSINLFSSSYYCAVCYFSCFSIYLYVLLCSILQHLYSVFFTVLDNLLTCFVKQMVSVFSIVLL